MEIIKTNWTREKLLKRIAELENNITYLKEKGYDYNKEESRLNTLKSRLI